jgi:hypothetical protein
MKCVVYFPDGIVHSIYGMGMNTNKASGVVIHAPRVLFADICCKELAKFGMPLITTHHNDCLYDTKIFDIWHCMGIVFTDFLCDIISAVRNRNVL